MGLPLFSTRQCVIVPAGDVPMCAKVGEQHFIFLKTKDNHWCQWVYQFAQRNGGTGTCFTNNRSQL